MFTHAFQLEKVLQQGDIGECCEPYMIMKESDSSKVMEPQMSPVASTQCYCQGSSIIHFLSQKIQLVSAEMS